MVSRRMEKKETEKKEKNDRHPSLFYHLRRLTFCKVSIVNHVFPAHAINSIN